MKANDEILLIRRDGAAFDGGAEIVHPAEAAALAAAKQTGVLRKGTPLPFTVSFDVVG